MSWVEYFPVERNSKATPPEELIRLAPAEFPDALSSTGVGKVPDGANQPVFLELHVPREAKEGLYLGSIRVSALLDGRTLPNKWEDGSSGLENGPESGSESGSENDSNDNPEDGLENSPGDSSEHGSHGPENYRKNGLESDLEFTVPVELEVLPLELPEKTRLFVTLWVNYQDLARHHNVEMWSEGFWQVLSVYARDMARHHQNVILTPLDTVQVRAWPDGRFEFDFGRLDRWIEVFTDAGVLAGGGRLEFGHLGGRVSGNWKDQFALRTIWAQKVDADGRPTGANAEVPLSHFLKALQDYLEARGLLERAMLHIADEPIPENRATWLDASRTAHEAAPKLRRIDAVHVTDLVGDLEVWVPQLNFFRDAFDRLHELQRSGDIELWFYTAWLPQGNFPNRLMDYPLIKTRLLHWINFLYGATGYLHWGYNFWSVPFYEFSPGDNWIVWPGPDGPKSSLRYEAMRQGIEDYEFLMMLVDATREAAKELAAQAGVEYREDAEVRFGGAGRPVNDLWDPRNRAVELARLVMREITDYTWNDARLLEVRTAVQREIAAMRSRPWALVQTTPRADEPLAIGAGERTVRVQGIVEAGTKVELEVPSADPSGTVLRRAVEVDPRGYFSAEAPAGGKRQIFIHLQKGDARKTLVRSWPSPEAWENERSLRVQMQRRAAGHVAVEGGNQMAG